MLFKTGVAAVRRSIGLLCRKVTDMSADEFEQSLVKEIPRLRSVARALVKDPSRADDLVQEALGKAWKARTSFATGTNLRAWLSTILRNVHLSECRKYRREVDDPDGYHQKSLAYGPEQQGHADLADLRRALAQLPPSQHDAVILVGAVGYSYEEAAELCRQPIGTIKSRVNRARSRLVKILGHEAMLSPD